MRLSRLLGSWQDSRKVQNTRTLVFNTSIRNNWNWRELEGNWARDGAPPSPFSTPSIWSLLTGHVGTFFQALVHPGTQSEARADLDLYIPRWIESSFSQLADYSLLLLTLTFNTPPSVPAINQITILLTGCNYCMYYVSLRVIPTRFGPTRAFFSSIPLLPLVHPFQTTGFMHWRPASQPIRNPHCRVERRGSTDLPWRANGVHLVNVAKLRQFKMSLTAVPYLWVPQ